MCGIGTCTRSLGLDTGDPFSNSNQSIVVRVYNLNETVDVTEFNVMLAKDLRDLVCLDLTVLVLVEEFETLIDGKSLVTE